ncbi:hypothetical protein [Arthrobacter sp. H14]|uniref:hypothetical protein n=1 Tax=Arthrobacter sp. H14 TaxID=1312959 RepID=UPI00047ECE0B|nr:hypothetical protein [Arthrobacter sp. H14]
MNDRGQKTDKDFHEAVNRRLEDDSEEARKNSGDGADAFRQQRDEDEDSVLEEEKDEGTPVKPDNS